jgi:23S rRNA (cytidine1920-2'-O)/16S rRNA (cytidine1409-2'-O)-methyltransferase
LFPANILLRQFEFAMKKARIDNLLIKLNFADSLPKAQALIMSGVILANEKRVEKSSESFNEDVKIRIKGNSADNKYVGRGGIKLEKALKVFRIHPNEYVCLDVGSSTGGFTDCLLMNGAKKVVAVDSGTNQIVWKLRKDKRVEIRENVNARYLKPNDFVDKFDLIVMDVSFISVRKILPALLPLLKDKGKLIVLIKPQFEVSRDEVGAGGVVREADKHRRVVAEINSFAETIRLKNAGVIESPILGASGNKEFLALFEIA